MKEKNDFSSINFVVIKYSSREYIFFPINGEYLEFFLNAAHLTRVICEELIKCLVFENCLRERL